MRKDDDGACGESTERAVWAKGKYGKNNLVPGSAGCQTGFYTPKLQNFSYYSIQSVESVLKNINFGVG